MTKNAPALHHYEMLLVLYELNLINRNADYISNSTGQVLDVMTNFMQLSLDNADEITRNNLDAFKNIIESSSQVLNSVLRQTYLPFWLRFPARAVKKSAAMSQWFKPLNPLKIWADFLKK